MVAAHLFVADLDALDIDDRDRHHVDRVLRLRDGESVTASDGAGGQRPCRVVRKAGAAVSIDPVGPVAREPRPTPEAAVGFALVKHDRPEWIVQKLTECGIDRIVPFVATRTIVRWDDAKKAVNHERWTAVAREAAMQSRRTWLPVIDPIISLAALDPAEVVRADLGEGDPPAPDGRVVLIGPEGGWDDAERRRLPTTVSLGPHVLRAETAAIAAATLLVSRRNGLIA